MKSADIGVLARSSYFSFTPSALAEQLYFYITECGHYYCSSRYMFKRDFYPPLLVIYVREGIIHVQHEGRTFDAGKGDVVLLDCSRPHYYQAEDGLEFTFIHFDGSNAHELVRHILDIRRPLIRSANNLLIGNLIYNTIQFYENGGIESMSATSLRVYKLLQLLSDADTALIQEDSPVSRSIHYIREHLGEKLTLNDLAGQASMSAYYFSHCFKRETGFSPMDYVISARMDRAKSLLVQTDKTVTEIAYQAGYSSLGSFINAFTDKVGCSPKTFRRLMRPVKKPVSGSP